ncbi:hypothetical protein ABF87_13430 [Nitrosomonas sp. JL21]|nr:hypothetical protein [Nitrosomonas sp.]MXS78938.1 hypothetical protein [Nitrosomonas sp. JL21]
MLGILLTIPAARAADPGQSTAVIDTQALAVTQFVVMGDMPYNDVEYALLEHSTGAIAAAIKALDPPALIHIGDFKKGRLSCGDDLFRDHYRQIAFLHPHRIVYTPGDNDWTDCDRFTLAPRHDELERLAYLRQLFFHQDAHELSKNIPGLVRQQGFIENARWKIDHVSFATLHIPGTNNGRSQIMRSNVEDALNEADYRDQANEEWLQQLFAEAESAQAVVIAFHADIFEFDHNKPACSSGNRTECDGYRSTRDSIKQKAAAFKKPVLLVHGDTLAYCLHQPYAEIPNLWRLNTPGDHKYIDISHVLVDTKDQSKPFKATGVLDQKPAPAICDHTLLGLSLQSSPSNPSTMESIPPS